MRSTDNPIARMTCPLFIPGNRPDMLAKAARYGNASAIVPDLEDSVPDAYKDDALNETVRAMPDLVATGKPIIPRVNSIASGRSYTELNALVGTGIAGVSIGKMGNADDIGGLDASLSELENARDLPIGSTILLPWLESAAAIANAYAICSASSRVRWVAFGAEDYCADMGIMRDVDSDAAATGRVDEYGEASLLYARSAVAVAARAAGVQAIDTPFVKFRDVDGLRAEASLARRLGYAGKFAIHPAQIDAIRDVWRPTDAEVARAKRILEESELASAEGRGAISLDGEMIDAPVVARARNILQDAEDLA